MYSKTACFSIIAQRVGGKKKQFFVHWKNKDVHLGASRSSVSLGSIQTAESLQKMTKKCRWSHRWDEALLRICQRCRHKLKLTLCPLMPGRPGVPGNPRAPCRDDKGMLDDAHFDFCFLVRTASAKAKLNSPEGRKVHAHRRDRVCQTLPKNVREEALSSWMSPNVIFNRDKLIQKGTHPGDSHPLHSFQGVQRDHGDPWHPAEDSKVSKSSPRQNTGAFLAFLCFCILTAAPASPGSPGGPVNPWGPCWGRHKITVTMILATAALWNMKYTDNKIWIAELYSAVNVLLL